MKKQKNWITACYRMNQFDLNSLDRYIFLMDQFLLSALRNSKYKSFLERVSKQQVLCSIGCDERKKHETFASAFLSLLIWNVIGTAHRKLML